MKLTLRIVFQKAVQGFPTEIKGSGAGVPLPVPVFVPVMPEMLPIQANCIQL